MTTVDELFDALLATPRENVIKNAKHDAYVLLSYLSETLKVDRQTVSSFFYSYVALFMQADKDISDDECELLNEILDSNYSYDQIRNDIGHTQSEEEIRMLDNIIDRLPRDVKMAAVRFGVAFIIIDGEATEEEKEIFARILR